MAKNPQPATKSYFFDKGYRDVANTIKGAWIRNWESIKHHYETVRTTDYDSWGQNALAYVCHFFAILAVVIFGTCCTAAITMLNIGILLVFMAIVYIGFTVIWIVDRVYLLRKKIFTACSECKTSSLIPIYICSGPNCNQRHTNLTPGVYGILKRRCTCGELLPTTFFNGRKELEAICPGCFIPLTDRESRPVCIPVVGGRSVGKTAFITAFSNEFVEKVAPSSGIEIEFYNSNKQEIYHEITKDFQSGSTRMTARSGNVNQTSSVSFSFFAKHPSFVPERLMHVYDIAGEVFTDNSENEVQKQYEYCHGIVLIVDPFAIPSVRYKYEEKLSPEDIAGIGKADINEIINVFLNKLREVTGLSDKKVSTVPLAVVISKVDSGGLDEEIGEVAVHKLMGERPEEFTNFQQAQDHLCRDFLQENEMGSFLSNVNIQFKHSKFFACSAIGHTRDKGKYQPKGVMPVMQWLCTYSDKEMANVWNETVFLKEK